MPSSQAENREQTFDETIPEDSIHPPQSSNPDPAQGLRELVMSNTKQQIKEILTSLDSYYHENLTDDEVLILYPELRKAVDAIDRLVTEAKQDVLKELVEWYEYALSVDDTSFDWYRAVKALMVSKDHKKPFSQLSNKENI